MRLLVCQKVSALAGGGGQVTELGTVTDGQRAVELARDLDGAIQLQRHAAEDLSVSAGQVPSWKTPPSCIAQNPRPFRTPSVQPVQVPSLPAHSLACAPCSCAKRPASRAGARIVGQCTCWAGSTTSFPRAFAGVVCSILPVSDPPPPSPCPAQRHPPTAPRSWRLRRPPRYCRPAGPPARPGGHCGCAGMARRRRPTGGCGG